MTDETTTEEKPKRATRAATTKAEESKLNIIQVISKVTKEAGGLEATQKAGSGIKFPYRGVDDVVTHLKAKLDEEGVIYTPRLLSNDVSTREVGAGKAITQSSIVVEYTFHAPDGSTLTASAPGLAHDYADRSAAQAMSVALRTVLIQIFKLQANGDPEAAGEDVQRYIESAAKEAPKSATPAAKGRTAADAREDIAELIKNGTTTGDNANALGNKIANATEPSAWMGNLAVLEQVVTAIKNGELA